MTEEKLKGFMSFKEVSEYLFGTGQLHYDQYDYLKNLQLMGKALFQYARKQKNSIFLTSTPKQTFDKGVKK